MNPEGNKSTAAVGSNVANVWAFLSATKKALSEGRIKAAEESAVMVLMETDGLRLLERVFTEAQKLDLLVKLLWDRRDTALTHLAAVAAYMRMSAAVGNGDEQARLRSWLFADSTAPVRFSHLDFLGWFKGLDKNQQLDLLLIKYRGSNLSSAERFGETIQMLASRCDIPRSLLDFLYRNRDKKEVDYPSWRRDVQWAQALCNFFRDFPVAQSLLPGAEGAEKDFLAAFVQRVNAQNFVNMDKVRKFFNELDTTNGLLLCTFHGAFSFILNALYHRFMAEHYSIVQMPAGGSANSAIRHGDRGAAFRAAKALMQKKAVFMAPDGPHFNEATGADIRIFGSPTRISASAAMLAYETGSDTGWCSLTLSSERLVPVFALGPRRNRGESYECFRDRWLSFYSSQIEAVLASNPRNLSMLSSRWSSLGSRVD
jgi:hypothetical protein